jgi:hypothetical protein
MAVAYDTGSSSAPLELTKFEPRHVPGALRLSQGMTWPNRREDWEFAAAVGQGFVLEREGAAIGTAMWWNYGRTYASAGMIIVTHLQHKATALALASSTHCTTAPPIWLPAGNDPTCSAQTRLTV